MSCKKFVKINNLFIWHEGSHGGYLIPQSHMKRFMQILMIQIVIYSNR
ncbi:hypothetical protein glysoja_015133 [Glycine soja]|nr:hypothetical protein glysoja_015133 [Glycine soja]